VLAFSPCFQSPSVAGFEPPTGSPPDVPSLFSSSGARNACSATNLVKNDEKAQAPSPAQGADLPLQDAAIVPVHTHHLATGSAEKHALPERARASARARSAKRHSVKPYVSSVRHEFDDELACAVAKCRALEGRSRLVAPRARDPRPAACCAFDPARCHFEGLRRQITARNYWYVSFAPEKRYFCKTT